LRRSASLLPDRGHGCESYSLDPGSAGFSDVPAGRFGLVTEALSRRDPFREPDGGTAPKPGASPGRLPTGTVTFLFTDLEGSTRMWEQDPGETGAAVVRHERRLRRIVGANRGHVVKGTGDGVLAVFASANDALTAAVQIQMELHRDGTVRARIGLNTGEADLRNNDYYGVALNRCQRVMAAAHGGQIVLTIATEAVLAPPMPEGVTLLDLGKHRLRDVAEAVRIFQVVHPELPSAFPPLQGAETFAHNLPADLTGFVGREAELAETKRSLAASRLVTLTGVGGGGKSRLALRVAADLLQDAPGGVWLVELAYLAEPALVPRTVAQAIGVPEEPGRKLLESVGMRLREAPALLVLDNCEHLLEASAETTDQLLRTVPGLRILATSRQRLGVPGEAVCVVSPMSVPDEAESRTPEAALRFDAVQLFAQRAGQASSGFRVTAANCGDVGRICRAVDGIPLALELAAGRVAGLSVAQIAARLGSRLEIASESGVTVDHRHRTMLTTLDWSYDLLSPHERELLAQLAVFRGSFDLEQIEAICEVGGLDELVAPVIALIDKSLLTRSPATGRYRLLEPVRRYAWDKLVMAGQAEARSRRHAEYFAAMAGAGEGADESTRLDRLEEEHDNLRAALRWSLEAGDGNLALRIGSEAWDFWKLRGHVTEGRDWLAQALEASEEAPAGVLAGALRGAGDLAAGQGDDERAREYLERSLELTERLGDDAGAAATLTRLAGLPHRRGDLGEATRLLEDALARAHRSGDPRGLGHILASLALLSEDQGRMAEAEAHVAAALENRGKTRDLYVATDALLAEGEIGINRGDGVRARRALEEALQTARAAGFTDVISWATAYLGKLAVVEGHTDDGERLLSEALAMFQRLGHPLGASWAMRHLGRAVLEEGDVTRAEALLREALRISLDQIRPDVPLVLQAIGELEVRRGSWERAATLLGAAAAARQRMGLHLPPREDELQARLGAERFEALRDSGGAMTLDQAGAFAAG
jgi:predicted ATPase/class 3 adenylate cyclase